MKKLDKETKYKIGKILSAIVMVSFVAPLGFLVYKIATTSNDLNEADVAGRVKSDYILMLLECVLGIFAMMLPRNNHKKVKTGNSR